MTDTCHTRHKTQNEDKQYKKMNNTDTNNKCHLCLREEIFCFDKNYIFINPINRMKDDVKLTLYLHSVP